MKPLGKATVGFMAATGPRAKAVLTAYKSTGGPVVVGYVMEQRRVMRALGLRAEKPSCSTRTLTSSWLTELAGAVAVVKPT